MSEKTDNDDTRQMWPGRESETAKERSHTMVNVFLQ